jgi:hypothetical protein
MREQKKSCTLPTPERVPPVPIAQINPSTFPSVCFHISGPKQKSQKLQDFLELQQERHTPPSIEYPQDTYKQLEVL